MVNHLSPKQVTVGSIPTAPANFVIGKVWIRWVRVEYVHSNTFYLPSWYRCDNIKRFRGWV
jgi:hypothetical protein